MTQIFELNHDNPQPYTISKLAKIIENDGVLAIPTNSSYALVAAFDSQKGTSRIKTIRKLNDKHDFTLLFENIKQFCEFVSITNVQFRSIKANINGDFTFIMPAGKHTQKYLLTKRKTIGARIPNHSIPKALLQKINKPLASTSLILPNESLPLNDVQAIAIELNNKIDGVVTTGYVGHSPTTVIDMTTHSPSIIRIGGGDPSLFGL